MDTDSHMMKNSDWAAVAYLVNSKYGIDRELRRNRYLNNNTQTGCGSINDDAINTTKSSTTCEDAFGNFQVICRVQLET